MKTEVHSLSEADYIEAHEARVRNFENDYLHLICLWAAEEASQQSDEDMNRVAFEQIILAKQKIRELQEEIEQQEALARAFEAIVKRNKRQQTANENRGRGRPERSQQREMIAKKMTAKWVVSLKETLEIKSCRQLADAIDSSSERNWRRWLNGDAIPNQTHFEKLLGSKIMRGKFTGEPLHKIKTTPNSDGLMMMLSAL